MSFFDLALRTSAVHKDYFLELHQPDEPRLREFADAAAASLAAAESMARAPQQDFEAFLAAYFS